VGSPGLEKSSVTPFLYAHWSNTQLMNSGPGQTSWVYFSKAAAGHDFSGVTNPIHFKWIPPLLSDIFTG